MLVIVFPHNISGDDMESKSLNTSVKLCLIGIFIIIVSVYFSDFNIGNKIGFNTPVTSLIP